MSSDNHIWEFECDDGPRKKRYLCRKCGIYKIESDSSIFMSGGARINLYIGYRFVKLMYKPRDEPFDCDEIMMRLALQ